MYQLAFAIQALILWLSPTRLVEKVQATTDTRQTFALLAGQVSLCHGSFGSSSVSRRQRSVFFSLNDGVCISQERLRCVSTYLPMHQSCLPSIGSPSLQRASSILRSSTFFFRESLMKNTQQPLPYPTRKLPYKCFHGVRRIYLIKSEHKF